MSTTESGLHILVVDDESIVLEVLEEILVGLGHRVSVAVSTEGALELVRVENFDATFLDYVMPGSSGGQLHEDIRELDSRLADRSILMTGHESAEMAKHIWAFAAFLRKPFVQRDVIKALEIVFEPGRRVTV